MKTLVESCFALDTHILKKDLRRAREHERGIAGFINIPGGNCQSKTGYSFDYTPEYDFLVLQNGEMEQRIKLAESELHWGTNSLFECDCGRRASKLYLPPGATEFKCRSCYSLAYEVQNLNVKTKSGLFLYKSNRTLKAMNKREGMRSIFYGGKFTQRFMRWLKMAEEIGLEKYIEDARKLLLAMST